MNKNTITFITLSTVFGLVAVYIAKNWLASNQELREQQVKVVISAQAIATGTVLEEKHLSLSVFPKSMLPDKVINQLADAVGKVAKTRLYVGEWIRPERLADKGDGSALASLIGPQMRAVSIRVDDVVGVAGFLLPGNRVDILSTFLFKEKAITEVILAHVKILAIDQSAANNENKPQLVRAVTVEVDLVQAKILMSARSKGSLQLALRNPTDNHVRLVVTKKNEKSAPIALINSASDKTIDNVNAKKSHKKVELIRGIIRESMQIDI
jgi:pilus assembly protein CpaB